jgi:hypothetical protein
VLLFEIAVLTSCGQKGAVAFNGPFELRLETTDGPGLKLSLHNQTNAPHAVLRDSSLQPSVLTLTDAAGQKAEMFDERTRMKRDTSVSNGMYAVVAPGATLVLESGTFQKSSGVYELSWGPFRFGGLKPGAWKARASFESRIAYVTKNGEEVPASKPVWKGKLESHEVSLNLP